VAFNVLLEALQGMDHGQTSLTKNQRVLLLLLLYIALTTVVSLLPSRLRDMLLEKNLSIRRTLALLSTSSSK
jgi:hypothetical protein